MHGGVVHFSLKRKIFDYLERTEQQHAFQLQAVDARGCQQSQTCGHIDRNFPAYRLSPREGVDAERGVLAQSPFDDARISSSFQSVQNGALRASQLRPTSHHYWLRALTGRSARAQLHRMHVYACMRCQVKSCPQRQSCQIHNHHYSPSHVYQRWSLTCTCVQDIHRSLDGHLQQLLAVGKRACATLVVHF